MVLFLTIDRAELTEEQSEQLLSTLVVCSESSLHGLTQLTSPESCRVATKIVCCHTQDNLDFSTVLHQAHIRMDSMHS
jgi:hypothetical protein